MSGGVAYVWNKDGNFDYFVIWRWWNYPLSKRQATGKNYTN